MGGNAVEGVLRADPVQYEELKRRVHVAMNKYFLHVETPIEFPNKPSYGDVDVLYAPFSTSIVSDVISIEFGVESAQRAVINGKTVSFPLDNIQIDLIGETIENFEIAVRYYSYGDLGRVIGAIAHWYGLRWGKHGLSAPINCRNISLPNFAYPWNLRDNENISTNDWETTVSLSMNCLEVLEYLGLDAVKFDSGFAGGEVEIWNWIVESPYFDIDIFRRSIRSLHDGSCHKSNMRPTYCRFLNWISANVPELHFRADLPNAIEYFNKVEIVSALTEKYRRHVDIKQKFSGRLLLDIGVRKQHIGILLKWLKQYFEKTIMVSEKPSIVYYADMDTWVENSNSETIREWTVQAVEVWRENNT